jgi:hypothetical protein
VVDGLGYVVFKVGMVYLVEKNEVLTGGVLVLMCDGVLDVYSSAVYVSDGTAPLSGPYVMDVALAAGAASGGVQLNGTFTGRPREVFAGFWIKTNADFDCHTKNRRTRLGARFYAWLDFGVREKF